MKGSMKKLAVFAVIAAIATFTSAGTALASGNHWKVIHGKYAATSTLSCNGYYENGSLEGSGTISQLAIYTFNGDGTGSMQGKFVRVGFLPAPVEMNFDFSWDFNYWVGDDGTITTANVPGTAKWKAPGTDFVVLRDTGGTYSDSGWVSADRKTIILGTVEAQGQEITLFDGTVFLTKCNASRFLIRVGD
jgi:hypothetical protein